MLIPEVKGCIQVNSELHVKLFYKGCSVPLPQWFRQGQDCRLLRKSMLENFPIYLESYIENISPIFDELQKQMFTKKPVYSAKIVRYALLLWYTSIQSYRMLLQHFPLPTLSLLRIISIGTTNEGKISNDVCLMFDEMYLQKCEEYSAGDLVGCNSEDELCKRLVCFMITGLKNSILYMIKSSPETKINADWLREELIDCLRILSQSGFNVTAIVCDNHPSNLSSFKNLLKHFNRDPDKLFIWYELRKIYLFNNAAHLVKNIRNNLSNYKRFIFPSFKFDGFKDHIKVQDEEIKWKFFHDVHEKNPLIEANLRKALKLKTKVLHQGNCEQNVLTALVIFHATTAAAIQSYFPDESSTVEFLKLFSKLFQNHIFYKQLPWKRSS